MKLRIVVAYFYWTTLYVSSWQWADISQTTDFAFWPTMCLASDLLVDNWQPITENVQEVA